MKLIKNGLMTMLFLASTSIAFSQKKVTPTQTTHPTPQQQPKSKNVQKTEAALREAEQYAAAAQQAKTLMGSIIPMKTRDTVYIVIAGIKYSDPNLKLLKQKMDDVKATSGLISTYRNGMAVIKILYKGGDASGLYDLVSEEVKELFLMEDLEGPRMVLNYKHAAQPEPAKPTANNALNENQQQ